MEPSGENKFLAKLQRWWLELRHFVEALRQAPAKLAEWCKKAVAFTRSEIQALPGQMLALWGFIRQTAIKAVHLTVAQIFVFFVKAAAALVAIGLIVAIGVTLWPAFTKPIPDNIPVEDILYLSGQGFGASRESPERETFYYTPQGSTVKDLRYSWFVHLEQPWSKTRLADPDNMRRFRFLVDLAPTPQNPDQLPVGFTRHFDAEIGEDVLDITCAACHTGQLVVSEADGKRYALRIDGGQATHAFTDPKPGHFLPELISSLAATYFNPIKFYRFARAVLGRQYPHGYWKLHGDVGDVLWEFTSQALSDGARGLYPTEEGFGRTDAIDRIANTVFGDHLTPGNYRVGNAPVSYPPVWDIWKFDWVQYTGSVRQPMARNLGETLGTGAKFQLMDSHGVPVPEHDRYTTSTMIANLDTIERTLQKLKPPAWPENVLGPIDCGRAQRGKDQFMKLCFGCHGPHNDDYLKAWQAPLKGAGDPHWEMHLEPVEAIGTDATSALNFATYRYDLSKAGLTADQVRRLLLPMLAADQKGWYAYMQAEVARLEKKTSRSCWDSAELSGKKAELQSAGQSCWTTLYKLDAVERARQAACRQAGSLQMLAPPACAAALGVYKQSVMSIAQEASQACPAIAKILDGVNIQSSAMGQGLNYIGILMREKYYQQNGYMEDVQDALNGFGILDLPQVLASYKARPLAGAWATAPYLHNGSVPTLYQLLSPVDERSPKFPTGQWLFDKVNVGLVTEPDVKGGVMLDTAAAGNSNSGHEFRAGYVEPCQVGPDGRAVINHQYGLIGPALTHDQRMDIIEYLKIRRDDPQDAATEFPAHCAVSPPGGRQSAAAAAPAGRNP